MTKLEVNIQNCYGIGKFEKKFDFSKANMYLIYAQNGIFKTSFAKTLKDVFDSKEPKQKTNSLFCKFYERLIS